MRQMISGLVAAVAVMAAAPAMACGYSPCVQPQVYVAPVQTYSYSGCDPCGGGGWGYERLADPVQQYGYYGNSSQYYYVNQGPAYSGPGNFAPIPTYQEGGVSGYSRYGYGSGYGYRHHRHYRPWYPRESYYHAPRMHHYGYAPRRAYAPQYSSRYAPAPYHYGHRVLRRYY